jgi:hypothetical protein
VIFHSYGTVYQRVSNGLLDHVASEPAIPIPEAETVRQRLFGLHTLEEKLLSKVQIQDWPSTVWCWNLWVVWNDTLW